MAGVALGADDPRVQFSIPASSVVSTPAGVAPGLSWSEWLAAQHRQLYESFHAGVAGLMDAAGITKDQANELCFAQMLEDHVIKPTDGPVVRKYLGLPDVPNPTPAVDWQRYVDMVLSLAWKLGGAWLAVKLVTELVNGRREK